jgi:DNA-binding transcriptional MerR regulator
MKTVKDLKKILRNHITSIKSIGKYLDRIEALSKDPVGKSFEMEEILKRMEKEVKALEAPLLDEVKRWIEEKRREVDKAKEEMRHEFAKRLGELLKEKGKRVEGRYPLLRVGFFSIEVDFTKRRASLLFGHEKILSNIPLDPEKVVKGIEVVEGEIMKPIDFQREMDLLYESYRRVLKLRDLPLGERVPIMEVLQQYLLFKQPKAFLSDPVRKNFRGYGRVQFGYDLYRLKKSGVRARGKLKMVLVTATFDATRKKENFIWVPDDERGNGTTYSYIAFKGVV